MNIDAAVPRPGEKRRRQDKAIGRHDQYVEPRGKESRLRRLARERRGLLDRKAAFLRKLLDRRRLELEPAAFRPIRLGEDQRHRETGIQQRGKHLCCERRRAGKTEIHLIPAIDVVCSRL